MKRSIFVLIALFCIFPSQILAGFQFAQFMKLGTISSDVKMLQQYLNKDELTRVATTGPGSVGFETERFGPLTHKAVINFQIKNGLRPDGVVGQKTRAKLNELVLAGETSTTPAVVSVSGPGVSTIATTTGTTVTPTPDTSKPSSYLHISSVSPDNLAPGATFDVYGSGFTSISKAYLGIDNEISFDYVDSGHIKIKVPKSEDLGGKFLYIRNASGDTRWTNPAYVMVSKEKIDQNSSEGQRELYAQIKSANKRYLSKATALKLENNPLTSFLKISVQDIFSLKTKKAQAVGINNFVGGKITSVFYCTCPATYGVVLTILDRTLNTPKTTAYQVSASTLRSNYNVYSVGPNVIGGTMPIPYTCEEINPEETPPCIPTGITTTNTIDFIRGIGTSAI